MITITQIVWHGDDQAEGTVRLTCDRCPAAHGRRAAIVEGCVGEAAADARGLGWWIEPRPGGRREVLCPACAGREGGAI